MQLLCFSRKNKEIKNLKKKMKKASRNPHLCILLGILSISNEFIERNIQTIKRALRKSLRTGDDPQMTLLMLRTAPLRVGSPTPATKLVGRTLRALVSKLETTNIKNKPKRHASKKKRKI